jgi:DnaK suppressor protein
VAKKAPAKKTGQRAAPKAARTAQPKKATVTPRPAKSTLSRSGGAAAAKKTPSRTTPQPVTASKVLAKTSPVKKVDPGTETAPPKKPAPAKVTAPETKKAPALKIEPAAKVASNNNRPSAAGSGVDGRGKAKLNPADGTAPRRNSKPVRIDRRPVLVEMPAEIPPTYLTAAELESFREMLLQKRHELIGDVANLEDGAIRSGGSHNASGLSSMPIHMADLGSDTWEQELTLGLIENERGLLREIDEALERIKDRTYGMCLATGKPITKARLRAKPWAKYCIEYARKRELGLV